MSSMAWLAVGLALSANNWQDAPLKSFWLGVNPSKGPCPAPPPDLGATPSEPKPLDRFCGYEVTNPGTTASNGLAELSRQLEGLVRADIGRVRPQAGWPTTMSSTMAAGLWSQLAARSELPAHPALPSMAPRVRLAIVDTTPDGAPQPRSQHATTLAGIARAMVCPATGPCAVDIRQHLALPRLQGGGIDPVNGGHYGTLWELATAIREATDDALLSMRATDRTRMVLNLSLGWDPVGGPSLPAQPNSLPVSTSSLAADFRSVHAALMFARCSGAVILAAAGNDDFGARDRSGPLLPAGWGIHPAPTATECNEADYGHSGHQPGGMLLTPVGGLDHRGEPLSNVRPGATPPLVAPGSGAVSPTGGDVLTGSSVGTVVTSAATALAWAIAPQLGPDEALALVEDAAIPLTWAASFNPTGGQTQARRVSICRTEEEACRRAATPCSRATCPSTPAVGPWSLFTLYAGASDALARGSALSITFGSPVQAGSCGLVRLPAGVTSFACPLDHPAAARNLDVSPQPIDPMCPACFLYPDGDNLQFVVHLKGDIPGGMLRNASIKVTGSSETIRYGLPGDFTSGTHAIVDLGADPFGGDPREATLQYELLDSSGASFTVGEPIIVYGSGVPVPPQ